METPKLSQLLTACLFLLRFHTARTVPQIPPTPTQYGIMIDAGSSGSRAHLFEWKTRRVSTLPPPLSYPVTSVSWTEKVRPGLSAYWQYPKSVKTVLAELIEWVKDQIKHLRKWWAYYPIYLKATAGVRELDPVHRKNLMNVVREFFTNNKTCPFYFQELDAARTISGEEEAAYAWTAINYGTGALLKFSWGSGTAKPLNAYGSLELGGASAQIAFFDPNQDIMANLFKVQVGQQRHWNIYAHSYLHYGHNSARRRMWGVLAEKKKCFKPDTVASADMGEGACSIRDYCLPKGYVYPPYLVPASSDGEPGIVPPYGYSPSVQTLIRSPLTSEKLNNSQWELCLEQIRKPLGFYHDPNSWCAYSHRDQCSFQGVYQPPLPDGNGPFGQFFLFGEYHDVWSFLNISTTATLEEFMTQGMRICKMDFVELTKYNLALGDKTGDRVQDLPEMCFLSAYTFSMLYHGYGFELNRTFTSTGKIDYDGVKLKIGWPLGAMLYEINTLPWEYTPDPKAQDVEEGLSQTTSHTKGAANSDEFIPQALKAVIASEEPSTLTLASEVHPDSGDSLEMNHVGDADKHTVASAGRHLPPALLLMLLFVFVIVLASANLEAFFSCPYRAMASWSSRGLLRIMGAGQESKSSGEDRGLVSGQSNSETLRNEGYQATQSGRNYGALPARGMDGGIELDSRSTEMQSSESRSFRYRQATAATKRMVQTCAMPY